jgi:hypothetical protein
MSDPSLGRDVTVSSELWEKIFMIVKADKEKTGNRDDVAPWMWLSRRMNVSYVLSASDWY